MKQNYLSKKRRQLSYAAKRINRWRESGHWDELTQKTRHKWISKLNRLFRQLDGRVAGRLLKKTLAGAAIFIGLSTTSFAQQFTGPIQNPAGLKGGLMTFYNNPAFVDIDDDGDLDLFITNEYGPNFFFFENGLDSTEMGLRGGVANPFGLSVPIGNYYPTLAFGDMDNDGDQDIIMGAGDSTIYYIPNNGSPTAPSFGAAQVNPFGIAVPAVSDYNDPSIVDLDGDGDLDILLGNENGDFVFLQNIGTVAAPAFGPASLNPFGLSNSYYYASPVAVDFDNDGDLDILAGTEYGSFFYLENTGSATAPAFAAPTSNPFNLITSQSYPKLDAADIDNDGDVDLLVGEYLGSKLFENTGRIDSASFGTVFQNPFALSINTYFLIPSFVDIDNDGDLDLAAGEYYGVLNFRENIGTPDSASYVALKNSSFGLSFPFTYLSIPEFADIDNDGDQDLLLGRYYGNLEYFENTGTADSAAFAPLVSNPFGLTSTYDYAFPAFVDLDRDGDLDLFVGEYGGVQYFENTGTAAMPSFAAPVANPFGLTNLSTYFSDPVFSDFDRDGDIDLMVGEVYGTVRYFENVGGCDSAAFAAPVSGPFGLVPTPIGQGLALPAGGDIDSDGDTDILVGQSYGNSQLFVDTDTTTAGQLFNVTASICEGDTLFFGSQALTVKGVYQDLLIASNGCDSLVNLTLNVNPVDTVQVSETICSNESFQFGTQTLTAAGNYMEVFASSVTGCDSVVMLDLAVNTPELGVTQIGATLTSDAIGASYQWLDCSTTPTPIVGATDSTYTPLVNGQYSVVVTDPVTACTDTSACIPVTNVSVDAAIVPIQVRPTLIDDYVEVDLGIERSEVVIGLMDLRGKVLFRESYRQSSLIRLPMGAYAKGVYLIQVEHEGKLSTFKVVKE